MDRLASSHLISKKGFVFTVLLIFALIAVGCAASDKRQRIDECVKFNTGYSVGDKRYKSAIRVECSRLEKGGKLPKSGETDVYVTCPPTPTGKAPCSSAQSMMPTEINSAMRALIATRLEPLTVAGRTADLAVTVSTEIPTDDRYDGYIDEFAMNEGLSRVGGFTNDPKVACGMAVVVAGETGKHRSRRADDLQKSIVGGLEKACANTHKIRIPQVAKVLSEQGILVRTIRAGGQGHRPTSVDVKVMPNPTKAAKWAKAWNREKPDLAKPDHARAASDDRLLVTGYAMDSKNQLRLDIAFAAAMKVLLSQEG